MTDIFDDLVAEYEQLDAVLAALTPAQWSHPSAAAGWTVSDVVLHLAQSEELVLASLAGELSGPHAPGEVDAVAAAAVAAQRDIAPADLLARWRAAVSRTPAALRGHPRGSRLSWVAATLSPATMATTRLAEHWAHAHDITEPLGIAYPDTARLRHIAWLGHRTLPYAFDVEGLSGGPVRCELTAPDGDLWRFGDPAAPSAITGPAADFCRVGARRLAPSDSALKATGPHGAEALAVLRNYAF
ncbi:maleylpyruvate isomerase family mycothiol-dependent enzyme [Nonomuraea candida]|uniref:maleylpyruvate isomerase family mycothiol-dependent enzyme n=1 Tax=Nonomuraea candida TaxID=359159 RepID=UPI0005BAFF0E|nr:maleylpyruvate isomerase family mycothiol-dependent enzyme [Nonomuraea candida]